jgi:hypothetical protein
VRYNRWANYTAEIIGGKKVRWAKDLPFSVRTGVRSLLLAYADYLPANLVIGISPLDDWRAVFSTHQLKGGAPGVRLGVVTKFWRRSSAAQKEYDLVMCLTLGCLLTSGELRLTPGTCQAQ